MRIGRRNAVRYPFTICAVSEGHITPICTAATTFSIMDAYLSQLHDFHCDPDNPRSRCRRNTPTGTFPHRNHDGHCEGLRDALAILRHEYETRSVHFEEPSQRTTTRTGQQNKRTPRARPRPPSRIKQSWQQPVTAPPPQRAPLPQFHERRTYGRRLRVLCPGRPYSPRVSSHRSVHCHHPRCHRLHLPDDDPMPNNGGSNSIDTWLVVNGMCTGKVLTAPSQINLTAAFQRDSLSHITALEPQ